MHTLQKKIRLLAHRAPLALIGESAREVFLSQKIRTE
jgi:hypothetical protein